MVRGGLSGSWWFVWWFNVMVRWFRVRSWWFNVMVRGGLMSWFVVVRSGSVV